MVLFFIGLAVSAFPAFFFMFLISDITELVFCSGGQVWISSGMLSGELWLSFNSNSMRVEVPALAFAVATFSFVVFLVCLVLLVIEIFRNRMESTTRHGLES